MGMKRKRLAYVKKFGKKFAGWLRTVKTAPTPAPAPEVKKPEPAPAPVIEENQEEKE